MHLRIDIVIFRVWFCLFFHSGIDVSYVKAWISTFDNSFKLLDTSFVSFSYQFTKYIDFPPILSCFFMLMILLLVIFPLIVPLCCNTSDIFIFWCDCDICLWMVFREQLDKQSFRCLNCWLCVLGRQCFVLSISSILDS